MNKVIEILKRCEKILISARAPKEDIIILRALIDNIENLDQMSFVKVITGIDTNYEVEKRPIKDRKIKDRTTKILSDIESIANAYRKVKNNNLLTDREIYLLKETDKKYSNLRSFILGDLARLYDRISEVDETIWSMEELKIILCFHFHIKPSKSTNKNKLLNQLKKNIYNLNYMDSMKKQYER
jgi:hypothetical protein